MLTHQAALASWATPNTSDFKGAATPEAVKEWEKRGHNLPEQAQMTAGSWPTPMAGTPAQNGNNEAGNTDSSRKTVALVHWNTPRATDGSNGGPNQAGGALSADAAMAAWATPSTRDFKSASGSEEFLADRAEQSRGKPLSEQAFTLSPWPTPNCTTGQGGSLNHMDGRRSNLIDTVLLSGPTPTGSPAGTAKPGQLNPNMSRWLQGLPAVWDLCAPTPIRKARK
jgi:hypothetical protein